MSTPVTTEENSFEEIYSNKLRDISASDLEAAIARVITEMTGRTHTVSVQAMRFFPFGAGGVRTLMRLEILKPLMSGKADEEIP